MPEFEKGKEYNITLRNGLKSLNGSDVLEEDQIIKFLIK